MPVIAVVNRKGGSGKSTFAAHVAAWCAQQGHSVMLGDVDRQQSSRAWLKRRDAALPYIAPWAMDQKNVLRVPPGITHVVLDTPGGLQGFELARIVMFADAIVIPLCHSVFDREAAAACHAELMTLPRVQSGRCRVAVVGMRIDGRTHASDILRAWAQGLDISFLGVLREAQLYVRSLEKGLTIFDLPPIQVPADLTQWQPILDWVRSVLSPPVVTPTLAPSRPLQPSRLGSARHDGPMPVQQALVHGSRLSVLDAHRMAAPRADAPRPTLSWASSDDGRIPDFLKRGGGG